MQKQLIMQPFISGQIQVSLAIIQSIQIRLKKLIYYVMFCWYCSLAHLNKNFMHIVLAIYRHHRMWNHRQLDCLFEVFSEIRFRKHPSQSSLYFNGAEYFYRQSWSSNYLFYVCVCYMFVWLMGQYWPFSVNKNYCYYYCLAPSAG